MFFLFLAACLALSSCGLEEYVFLYPPDTALSGDILTFSNNTGNDPVYFFGYKILYRFYPTPTDVDGAVGTVSSLYSSNPTTIYQKMKSSPYSFRDLGIGAGQNDELLIQAADRQDLFSVDLNFQTCVSSGEDATIVVSEGSPGTDPDISSDQIIYQTISGESYVGFSQADLVERAGVFEEGVHFAEGKTYLLLYVIAYGYNSSFGNVYSEPKKFVGTTSYVILNVAD